MKIKTDLLGDDVDIARIGGLVTKLFPQEEKQLFEFLEKNPVFKKPDWRHIWYYRFLQISPSYNLLLAMIDNYQSKIEEDIEVDFDEEDIEGLSEEEIDKREEERERRERKFKNLNFGDMYLIDVDPERFCESFPRSLHKNIRILLKTYKLNGDLRNKSLKEWWIDNGQYLFEIMASSKIEVIANIKSEKDQTFRKLNKASSAFHNFMEDTYFSKKNHALVLGISINNSKEGMMKVFSNFLDQTIDFNEPRKTESHVDIQKSRTQEKKFSEAYKILYFRYQYPELTLEELAKKANILVTSQHSKQLGSRSLETGISRILKEAIYIAENAAFNKYPEWETLIVDMKIDTKKYLNNDTYENIYQISAWSVKHPELVRDFFGIKDLLD